MPHRNIITDPTAYNAKRDRLSYPPIPLDATRFQHPQNFTFVEPFEVLGWEWSTTFGRWTALVTILDSYNEGWLGWTWPERSNG